MAYSDYGGYAYRNGGRVVERSDATITPESNTFGTPGMWPGFGLLAQGATETELLQKMQWPSGHAVLGDGPIFLVLRKSWASAYRGQEKLELDIDNQYEHDGNRETVEVDGVKIEVVYSHEDNYYVYAKLTQPDGTVWYGWSGYGVGAGLEDAGYGYSSREREDTLLSIWPDCIKRAL